MDKDLFKKTEGKLYRYYEDLDKYKSIEAEIVLLKNIIVKLEDKIKKCDVNIDPEQRGIEISERVQISANGISYVEREIEKASNKNSIGIRFLDRSKLSDEKEQIIKVVEEMYEFINAKNDENQLEEFYDLVQASLNLLQIRNFTLKEIREAEQKHIEKLRKRGWNV